MKRLRILVVLLIINYGCTESDRLEARQFEINAKIEDVFERVSTPKGIQKWWSKESFGTPGLNEEYILKFGVGYEWKAKVTAYLEHSEFELTIISADNDWNNTKIHFLLFVVDKKTRVLFKYENCLN